VNERHQIDKTSARIKESTLRNFGELVTKSSLQGHGFSCILGMVSSIYESEPYCPANPACDDLVFD
jgi:hypothetical protein